jgi:phosphohistidine phosphatase
MDFLDMELVFLRHGLAVDQEEWKGNEADRPLTAEGADRTKDVVRGLRTLKVRPDVILSSPLLRARETAEIAKKGLITDAKVELAEELAPAASPDRLIGRLADLADKPVVLCVGHEPHISTTLSAMVSGKMAATFEVKKAGACCIRFTGAPKAGTGTLLWLLPPKFLRVIADR